MTSSNDFTEPASPLTMGVSMPALRRIEGEVHCINLHAISHRQLVEFDINSHSNRYMPLHLGTVPSVDSFFGRACISGISGKGGGTSGSTWIRPACRECRTLPSAGRIWPRRS